MTQQDFTIREHMDVLGSDGRHIGTVDAVEAGQIKLTKSDIEAGGRHHYIPLDLISSVDSAVHLMIPADQALIEADVTGSNQGDDNTADRQGDQPA